MKFLLSKEKVLLFALRDIEKSAAASPLPGVSSMKIKISGRRNKIHNINLNVTLCIHVTLLPHYILTHNVGWQNDFSRQNYFPFNLVILSPLRSIYIESNTMRWERRLKILYFYYVLSPPPPQHHFAYDVPSCFNRRLHLNVCSRPSLILH